MKTLRTVLISGALTLGVFSMVAYTSCSKKDKCDSVTCKNGGTCTDGTCKCPAGYEGADCGTPAGSKFAGTYAATDLCSIGNRSGSELKYNVTIYLSNSNPLNVNVVGLANTNYTFEATVSNKMLTVAPQTMDDHRTYAGTAQFQADSTIAFTFNIKDSTGNYVEGCTSTLVKQ